MKFPANSRFRLLRLALTHSAFLFAFVANAADKATPIDPVVATVNGSTIRQSDLDKAMRLTIKYGGNEHASEKLKKEVLDDLITAALIESKLSRTGELKSQQFKDELDVARRSIVKNIFFGKVAAASTKVDLEQIDKFAKEHPDFFEDRKSFYYSDIKITREARIDAARIKGIVLTSNARKAEQKKLNGDPLDMIRGYLQAVSGDYEVFRGYRSSEQIDPAILADLKSMEPGKHLVDDEADKDFIHVLALYSVQPDPMDPVQSRAQIARGIAIENATKAAKDLLAQMRSEADIKYGKDAEKAAKKLKGSSATEIAPEPNESFRHSRLQKLVLVAFFSLLALLPAALWRFHRITAAKRTALFFVDTDALTTFLNRIALASHTPIFGALLAVVAGCFYILTALLLNGYGAFSLSPVTLAVIICASLIFGSAALFILWMVGARLPERLSHNRWLPIIAVSVVEVLALMVWVN